MTAAPDRRTVQVAAAQYPLDQVESLEAWTAKAERWVRDGATAGTNVLVFPEYGSIEIAAASGREATRDLQATVAAVADGQAFASRIWAMLADRYGVHILAPSGPERRGDRYVNAARLFAPGGSCGVQDKLILTPFERDWGLSAGSGQCVFETAVARIGIAICYDSEFPLLVRALAEAGAEIVLVPSCTEHVSGYHRVRNAAMARALESQIATVMSPTVSTSEWSAAVDHNTGAAGIFVPPDVALSMTGVLGEGVIDAVQWVRAEIDLTRLAALRSSGEMRNWADWSLQRGAAPLGHVVERVRL